MTTAPSAPLDVAARLHTLTAAWGAAQQEWKAEYHRLQLRIRDLEQQLQARTAGRSPVPTPAGLLSLFGESPPEPAPDAAPSDPAPRPRPATTRASTPGPQPLDPALPREEIALPDPPLAQRVCGVTGAPLVPGFTEYLEVLARRPAVYFVKRFGRTVWVSPAKSAPVATPWPADVLPRARMHASVVAHIAAAHFCEHVPYYRLEQQLARTGVSLARSTQVSLMAQLDTLVAPLIAHLKAQVLASGYVHLDATPVDVCDPARPGAARSATLWAYRARSPDPTVEGLVWFDYRMSKSPVHPRALLHAAQYRGVIQTDGAAGLDVLGPPAHITHLGCWAHARRYLADAVRLGEPRAATYLTPVDRLFRMDARARRIVRETPVARRPEVAARVATWRTRFGVPLVQALMAHANTSMLTLPPKSALAVALGYLLGQRASLLRCVTTPDAYLDNNAAENAIRPLKLGSKNWLFVGHPAAGPRLANLFTLVENCRQAGLDIEAYLLDLLTRLPTHSMRRLGDWLPRAWQRARADGITR
ncbi:MAG: IS66 family transposase [Gemmatimonadaceae bacterium]|nr:IS66 family transposase [Gemmatimonadaceae bacterium]